MLRGSAWNNRIVLLLLVACAVASPGVAATLADGSEMVTDVIVGHNNKGPYALSWSDIDQGSVSVIINGRSLKNGDEFNIDPARGILSFNSTLVNDAIVRVSYRTIPGRSKRASGVMSLPVTLNIFQKQDSSVQVTGLYAQDDPRNPEAAKTVIGLGAEKKWAATSFNSMFLLSQRTDSGSDTQTWERAAMKFGGDTQVGAFKLAGSYAHSGGGFLGANEYGIGQGKDVMDFSATFDAARGLQATARLVDTTDNAGHKADTSVKVTASPVQNVAIEANLANKVDKESEEIRRDVAIKSSPTRKTTFSAMFSEKDIGGVDDVTRSARLELRPFVNTTLGAAYNYVETGPRALTIKDYSAATRPWRFLSIAGSFRDREIGQDIAAPDSADVQISLLPSDYFAVTGSYQTNPEDNTGAVQNYNSATLGMSARVGSVGLDTYYSEKEEYLASRLSDEKRLGLEIPFFGWGTLTTGYKQARLMDGSEFTSNTYSLGYRHSIGSDFSLSLTGYYTEFFQDRMAMPDKSEYSAEASLGVKF